MHCDYTRELMLGYDWDDVERKRYYEALTHLQNCEACQQALGDFDHIRLQAGSGPDDVQPSEGWDAFEAKLSSVVPASRPKLLNWPYGLAASILLAVIGWGMYAQNLHQQSPEEQIAATSQVIAFTEQEANDHVKVFSEVSHAFDQRANWIMIGDRASDVGVSSRPLESAHELVTLRISATRDGKPLSTADLVIVPGQQADIALPCEDGTRFRYQVLTTAKDSHSIRIRVEIDREMQHDDFKSALTTEVELGLGTPISVGHLLRTEGLYDITVVSRLTENVEQI